MENRRDFLKKVGTLGSVAAMTSLPAKAFFDQTFPDNENILQGKLLQLEVPELLDYIEPLTEMTVHSPENGKIRVIDGGGNDYFSGPVEEKATFKIGGALGTHLVVLLDKKNRILDMAAFLVDTKT
ncbi:MAG TPA: twin-arginine translocation signal domain-containing protein, partial [Bacteroidales bacterium]|nr:twin-arginine translocation signal domain-containing protein [Bacteroidales bacterium]